MLAPWAADGPVERAAQPPHTIRQAHDHPQHAAAHRAALPARLAPPSCTNRRTTEYSTQHTPAARAQHTQTRARPQHAHVHSTRASHASAAPHTEHTSHQQQQPATIHISHTRAHTPPYRRTHWASPRAPKADLCGCLCCLLMSRQHKQPHNPKAHLYGCLCCLLGSTSSHTTSRFISPPSLASSRLISPHLASSRLTSLHLASPRLISPHLASSRLSPRLISPHTSPRDM